MASTSTTTQAGRTAYHTAVGTQTVVAVAVNTKPGLGGVYSIHDCAAPGFAELSNCVWPTQGGCGGSGGTSNNAPANIVVQNGVVVHTPSETTGNFTVTIVK